MLLIVNIMYLNMTFYLMFSCPTYNDQPIENEILLYGVPITWFPP